MKTHPAKYKAVVVGNDHYNTLNVIRALGQDNIVTYVIIIGDPLKSFVSKSKYIHKCYFVLAEKDIKDKLILLNKEISDNSKTALIATCDRVAAEIDQNLDILDQYYYLPSVGGRQGALVKEMSKNVQAHHAQEAGFNVPDTMMATLSKDNMHIVDEFHSFPCLIKPRESCRGSKDFFRVCANPRELLKALDELSELITNVVIQQYIPNDRVILIAGVRTLQGKNIIFGEIDKFKFSKNPNNLGLNCLGKLSVDSDLKELCKNYVDSIDFRGCYSIEVVRSVRGHNKGCKDWFVEINLRSDGLLYFYTKSDINYPSIWVKSCYGEHLDVHPAFREVIGMNEFNYLKNYLSWRSIKDFLITDTYSLFCPKDVKPFIYKFLNNGKS